MDDPRRYFRIEARELADELQQVVLDLEHGAAPGDGVRRLLRLAHTLKGAARVVRENAIADQAHALEGALGPFRESGEPIPAPALADLLALVDGISAQVAELTALAGRPAADAASPSGAGEIRPGATGSPAAEVDAGAGGAQELLEALPRTVRANLAEVDGVLNAVAEARANLQTLRDYGGHVDEPRELVEQLARDIATLRRDLWHGMGGPAAGGPPRRAGSFFERGFDSERALVRAHGAAVALRELLDHRERRRTAALERVDRELRGARDAAEKLRLAPASGLFLDLDRAARDVASVQGKQVAFGGVGGELRLDAHIVATAQAALHQLVRNAVAHGIELPADRAAAGKDPTGRVVLEVARAGRDVVFACRDDGRGIDLDAVRRAATARGLATGSREQLLDLLLRGGISTSGTVTEVAGRGIGIDVARDVAIRLGGRLTVATEAGRGTTVTMTIPLSVAGLDALVVEGGDGPVAIPLDAVRRTRRVAAGEIVAAGGGLSVLDGDDHLSVAPLAGVLWDEPLAPGSLPAWSMVLVESGGQVAAIGVRHVHGRATLALRPLPDSVAVPPTVCGLWVDDAGVTRLALDPAGLVAAAGQRRPMAAQPPPVPPILVVDDSLTTRMLEQSILESAGYQVDVAASGEEALGMAGRTHYALFLVDVEMPGMDGLTFVRRTRAMPKLRDRPCILVTSLASPEDRRRGLEAGAAAYLAKGEFDQGELLARVRELTARPAATAAGPAGAAS